MQRNVSAIVRERVLQAELDSSSSWNDAPARARIEMATSVIVEDARQTGGDARAGKLLCSASIAIEGMGGDLRAIVRTQTVVSYWISVGPDDRFLVGLAYSDLESIAAAHANRIAAPPGVHVGAGTH